MTIRVTMEDRKSEKRRLSDNMENNDKIDKPILDKFVLYGVNPALISSYLGLVSGRDQYVAENILAENSDTNEDINSVEKSCNVDCIVDYENEKDTDTVSSYKALLDESDSIADKIKTIEDNHDTLDDIENEKAAAVDDLEVNKSDKSIDTGNMEDIDRDTSIDKTLLDKCVLYGVSPAILSSYLGLVSGRDQNVDGDKKREDTDIEIDSEKDETCHTIAMKDNTNEKDNAIVDNVSEQYSTLGIMKVLNSEKDCTGNTMKNYISASANDAIRDDDRNIDIAGDTLVLKTRDKMFDSNHVNNNNDNEDAGEPMEENNREMHGAGYIMIENISETYDTHHIKENRNITSDGGGDYIMGDDTRGRVGADDYPGESDAIKHTKSDIVLAGDSKEAKSDTSEKAAALHPMKDIISEKQCADDTDKSILGAGEIDGTGHNSDGDMQDDNQKSEHSADTIEDDNVEKVEVDMKDINYKEKDVIGNNMEEDCKAKYVVGETVDDDTIGKNLALNTQVCAENFMKLEAYNSEKGGVVNDYEENDTLKDNSSDKDDLKNRPLDMEQFKILQSIGKGGYARVFLCLHEPSAQYFALKMLSSEGVARPKQVEHVQCEMDILHNISHPFIVPLLNTSAECSRPLLLFPYVGGGNLSSHLKKARKFSTSTALFFSAEIVSALSYLHSLGIVHRDLKPENILLDKEGHVVIVDFGFSKKITERSSTMCGTQKYLAPEIIDCTGHDKAVDWWALGILIYEMLVGYPPFFDDNPFLTSQKILTEKIKWPRKMDASAKDLIGKLLEKDKTRRLGSSREGAEDVKQHKFFTALVWEDVYHKGLKPPIVPEEGKHNKT